MNKLLTFVTVGLLALGIAGMASAQSASTSANGGDVAQQDITSTSDSTSWAGFYGNLTGEVSLNDGSGNEFFDWSVQDPSGSIVYAVLGTQADPTTATLGAVTTGSDADTLTGTSGTEAASNTYVDGTGAFQTQATPSTGSVSGLANTAAVDTNSSAGSFTSYLAEDTGNTAPVFFTETLNDVQGFNSQLSDYQLLATAGDGFSSQTFDFYVEIS